VGVHGQDTSSRLRFDYFLAPADHPVQGEAVYAGVAGRAAALDGSDGKVLLFDLPGAEPDAGWNGRAASALQLAIAGGAAGVVLVLDSAFPRYLINELSVGMAQQRLPIPLVGMTESAARALVTKTGADLDALRESGGPTPLGGAIVEIRAQRSAEPSTAPNVAAMLRGSDPGLVDTYVVLTAHFDHIGVGAPDASGDSIFNGADDNAAGTAALLEIAEAFAALPEPPARSILFLAVSGEHYTSSRATDPGTSLADSILAVTHDLAVSVTTSASTLRDEPYRERARDGGPAEPRGAARHLGGGWISCPTCPGT
jgi:hypothetical protein